MRYLKQRCSFINIIDGQVLGVGVPPRSSRSVVILSSANELCIHEALATDIAMSCKIIFTMVGERFAPKEAIIRKKSVGYFPHGREINGASPASMIEASPAWRVK
jgi:hypothetical protein